MRFHLKNWLFYRILILSILFFYQNGFSQPYHFPPQAFDEDDSLRIARHSIQQFLSKMNFTNNFEILLFHTQNIHYQIDSTGDLILFAAKDWYGQETVGFLAEDDMGKCHTSYFTVTVNPVSDPPLPFNLISPSGFILTWTWPMRFSWEPVEDPDPHEEFTYQLHLSRTATFADTLDWVLIPNHSDTYFEYFSPFKRLHSFPVYWKMTVWDKDSLSAQCVKPLCVQVIRIPSRDDSVKIFSKESPDNFFLIQNYPNPFNSVTTICFRLPLKALVHLDIFNAAGQCVRSLISNEFRPGTYQINWDAVDNSGQSISSGIYFCRIKAGKCSGLLKLILIR